MKAHVMPCKKTKSVVQYNSNTCSLTLLHLILDLSIPSQQNTLTLVCMSQTHQEMARILDSFPPPTQLAHPTRSRPTWLSCSMPISPNSTGFSFYSSQQTTVPRRNAMALILFKVTFFSEAGFKQYCICSISLLWFRGYTFDQFDGYSIASTLRIGFKFEVAGAEYISYQGSILFLMENHLQWSCRLLHHQSTRVLKTWVLLVADDGKLYYQVEVNIKSYANNNELACLGLQGKSSSFGMEPAANLFLELKTTDCMKLKNYRHQKMYYVEEENVSFAKSLDSFIAMKVANTLDPNNPLEMWEIHEGALIPVPQACSVPDKCRGSIFRYSIN
ncbi:LOW QUALITY PROTEIN: hypothetical protein NC653_037146 [Populus alba x Populus x berolinensis]|uniref:Uncharacterized protein n=1 Tax=Populus alba x Populus x berolinensis TaxID=444605 RepID=A0AAD6LLL3_9ROSI|nr:LOW QUALITY PROTEIN: hypothetical protein NC653_037146 [Populus alba x Populus x berolinensis]